MRTTPNSPETRAPGTDRAADTRQRILSAARAEFASVGFGGGRIDRIASSAGANKERIYAYFGDKRALFAAAIASAIVELGAALGQDAPDIVTFAGRLFDFVAQHPETLRLLTWARLEGDPWADATEQLSDLPVPEEMIARWQREGAISAGWDARDFYVMVWGLCEVWNVPPFRTERPDEQRRALVQYVVGVLSSQAAPPR